MRTASDFDAYYANTDPWRISGARSRDNVLRRSVARFVTGKKVLELEYGKYFTHKEVLDTLARHGISVIEFHNLNVHRKTPRVNRAVANVAAALVRAPFGRLTPSPIGSFISAAMLLAESAPTV